VKRSILAWVLVLALALGLPAWALASEPEALAQVPAEAAEASREAREADFAARREAAHRDALDRLCAPEEAQPDAALLAGSGTVSLSVRLPAGASLNGRVRAYLYEAAETDGTGLVIREPEPVQSQYQDVSGGGPIGFRFENVAAGSYFFGVYTGNARASGVASGTLYFNGDGSPASSQYLARGASLAAGATLSRSLSLNAPERSISGVLRFSAPLSAAASFTVEAGPYSSGDWIYTDLSAPAGTTELPFRLDVPAGLYCLDFYCSEGGHWSYLSYVNELSNEYDEEAWLPLWDGDLSGLEVNGDALLSGGTQTAETCLVTVTLRLPAPTVRSERVFVNAYSGSGTSVYTRASVQAAAGTQELSVRLNLPRDRAFRIGYSRLSSYDSNYYSASPDERYAAEEGITGLPAQAKRFTFTGETATVTITEPDCLKISGKLRRDIADDRDWRGAYAMADFADGEHYAVYAVFEAGQAETDYVIYVPRTEQGQSFGVSAAFTSYRGSNRLMESTRVRGGSYTLNGDTAAGTLAIPLTVNRIRGAMTFAVPAPAGGMLAQLQLSGGTAVRYLVPEGEQTLEFSYTDYGFGAGETVWLDVSLSGAEGMVRSLDRELTLDSDGNGATKFYFSATAVLQGQIFLPEGMADLGVNGYVQSSGDDVWNSQPFTIRKGQTATSYRLEAPQGRLDALSASVSRDSENLISTNTLYIDESWRCVSSYAGGPEVSGDRSGVDFLLVKGTRISGRICLPGGGAIPEVWDGDRSSYIGLSLEDPSGYRAASGWVRLAEDGSWSMQVSDELEGQYRLSVEIDSDINRALVVGTYYYSGGVDAVVQGADGAAYLTLSGESVDGLEVPVSDGWTLEGALRPAEGGYFRANGSYSCWVTAQKEDATAYLSYEGYAWITSGSGPWAYRVCVPKAEGVYRVSVDQDYGSGVDTNIIFQAERSEVPVSGDVSGVDLELPIAQAVISGRVLRPEGFTRYISGAVTVQLRAGAQELPESYEGSFYLSSNSGSDSYAQTDYRVLIPQGVAATHYTVCAEVYSSGLTRTLYATADGGVSTRAGEAGVFPLDGSAGHDFPLQLQPPYLSGKIRLPAEATRPFRITISAYGSQTFDVDPASCPSDETGRYFAYQLSSNDESFSYRPEYRVSSDENGCFETNVWYTLDADGLSHWDCNEVELTYYDGEARVLDFTPMRWDDGSEQNLIQSPHGVRSGSWSFRFSCPGAARVRFHFNQRTTGSTLQFVTGAGNAEDIYIYPDMEYTVYGNAVTLNYALPDNGQAVYGFGIDRITLYDWYGYELSALSLPTIVCAYGSSGDALSDIQDGSGFDAVLAGLREGQRVLAVIYDANGKELGWTTGWKVLEAGLSDRYRFSLPAFPDAASIKIILVNDDWLPLNDCWKE